MQLKHAIKSDQNVPKVSTSLVCPRFALKHGALSQYGAATRLDLLTVSCD
jgi:hypothetical protein